MPSKKLKKKKSIKKNVKKSVPEKDEDIISHSDLSDMAEKTIANAEEKINISDFITTPWRGRTRYQCPYCNFETICAKSFIEHMIFEKQKQKFKKIALIRREK